MTISIYKFKNTDDIYADMCGKFYRTKDDRPIPTCYHNGRIAVRNGTKRYGIKKLRKNAVKATREIIDTPF
jgi:hypothetical protein